MNIREFKQRFIEALMNRDVYTRRVNESWYVTRCPYCGDSTKNFNTGHFYIYVNPDDNSVIGYNCFHCPEHGVIRQEQIEKLGITDICVIGSIGGINSRIEKYSSYTTNYGDKFNKFNFNVPYIQANRWKIDYIEKRLGIRPDNEMIKNIKVITSLRSFLKHNEIDYLTCPIEIADMLENKYIGFLSYNSSHILFRDITDKEKLSWIKYPIDKKSGLNHVCYSLTSTVDIFTSDKININLAEGVFDILGIAYHLGYNKENCINFAICGKSYEKVLNHIISLGLVGSNISLNIFPDNDAKFNNKKNNFDTGKEYLTKFLNKYKYIFGEVNLYYNQAYKDCGTTKNNIQVKRFRL